MRIFNHTTKAMIRALKVLIQLYGVDAKIYKPVKYNNGQHGFQDNNVTYENVPVPYRVLIPAIFRKTTQTPVMSDPFFDSSDDIIWFVPTPDSFPRYSKVVISPGPTSYIVNDILEIKDGDQVIFRKHMLVINNALNLDDSRADMIDTLKDELLEDDVKTSLTTNTEFLNPKYKIDPITEA